GWLNIFGLNLLLGLGLLYFFQGLGVLAALLGRWSVPRPLRWAITILLLVQFYGMVMVAILGLADTWADFRNRPPKPSYSE
nr:DUF2232 domain-containing protein [Desulfobacteraceae bacterium]